MRRRRIRSSSRPTCDVPLCGYHFYPRKRGPHGACELVFSASDKLEGMVSRVLELDGTRTVHINVYDRQAEEWIMDLPLPRQPRKAWRDPVRRARLWLRATEGGLELPTLPASAGNRGIAVPRGSAATREMVEAA